MSPDQTASLPEQARSTNGLPPLSALLNRQRRVGELRTLLFGNGLSLRANLPFTWPDINRRASTLVIGPRAKALLRALPNLMPEDALQYLRGYPFMQGALETDEYTLLRNALVRAIADGHPPSQSALPPTMLQSISEFFIQFNALFTTNYDLLTYWAILTSPAHAMITDLFAPHQVLGPEPQQILRYDAANFPTHIPLRYLHGALHLVQRGPYVEKLSWIRSGVPLIQQIHQRIAIGEAPAIIMEGSADRKWQRIHENPYLTDSYIAFHRIAGVLVTYGWGFNFQDQHLVDAILQNPNLMEIWIGVYGDTNSDVNREMLDRINNSLNRAKQRGLSTPARIIYYDADSVPF